MDELFVATIFALKCNKFRINLSGPIIIMIADYVFTGVTEQIRRLCLGILEAHEAEPAHTDYTLN